MSITFNRITLALLSFCVVHNAYAELSAIDKKEKISLFSLVKSMLNLNKQLGNFHRFIRQQIIKKFVTISLL